MHVSQLCVTAIALLAISGSASAAGYLGATIGYTHLDDGGQLDGFDLDRSGVSGGIYGGFEFNRYLALEGAARWLGLFPSDISEQRYAAMTVSALGILPFNNTGLEGYLQGGFGAMLTSSAKELDDDDEIATITSSTAATWVAGLGIRYTPPSLPNFSIRAGYEYYNFEMRFSIVNQGGEGQPVSAGEEYFRQSIDNLILCAQVNF